MSQEPESSGRYGEDQKKGKASIYHSLSIRLYLYI